MKVRLRYRHNPSEVTAGFARYFRIGMTVLCMTVVALLSALITMRFAIHASEVEVPDLTNLTLEEAAEKVTAASLQLTVERRFYSTTVPAGRVLSQSPAAGGSVRKDWHMRVTESMGPQRVAIPDTVGMNEHDAGMAIRRASLDLGTLAYLPAPGPNDTVLAQTPPANAEGVDKPEVSLLLSSAETAANRAYVMPNLIGMSYGAAAGKIREMDLHLIATAPPPDPDTTVVGAPPTLPGGVVIFQSPAPGMRVSSAEQPRVKMSGVAAPDATTTP